MRTLVLCFCLLIMPSALFAQDVDINKVIAVLQNLTKAFNTASQEGHEIAGIAEDYLEFLTTNWPAVLEHLASFSQLPQSIESIANAITEALPVAETCVMVFSGCIVLSTIICTIPKLLYFFRKRTTNYNQIEMVVNET